MAKTKEKLLSMQLLLELIEEVDKSPEKTNTQFTLKEQLVSMFIYTYNGFSGRRSISDLNMTMKAKLLKRTPHFNSLYNIFKKPEMYSLLTDLVQITSLPLTNFEEYLTIDSSGFSTSMFERWLDIRLQKDSKKRVWKNVHLICGTKTNVIAGIIITPGNYADAPQLKFLVERTFPLFQPKELSADKAYLSRENLSIVSQYGAIPFIPFKKNSKVNPKGSTIWRAMWEFFYKNQDEFLSHYHKRSNSETTFSMVKRNFGNRLRFKDQTAQYNEILMKCLCHNLAVLVQETFELGLKVDFQTCAETYFAQTKS